jgi:hypothetical protein
MLIVSITWLDDVISPRSVMCIVRLQCRSSVHLVKENIRKYYKLFLSLCQFDIISVNSVGSTPISVTVIGE